MVLKRVYLVKMSFYIYSTRNILSYPMWDITNSPPSSPCRHNVLVVSHGIAGSNKQTPLTGLNKPLHQGRGSALIPFVTTHSQLCRYCSLWTKEALTALKHVYLVKMSLYIYSAKNILPYSMWNITNYKWYQSRSPTLMWGFVWPRKGCLSVWPRNPMGHNEDVVSAWGGCLWCPTSDRGECSWHFICRGSS